MTQEHSITPPPELVEKWIESTRANDCLGSYPQNYEHLVATQAARWGADQELEACCEWFLKEGWTPEHPTNLRAARRPKPPSLKERALLQLDTLNADLGMHGLGCDLCQIRRALESLPD